MMTVKKNSLSEEYFDDVYGANADPWNFETSVYEKEKYSATINALPKEIYQNAFEPGCSLGFLSELLAPRTKKLLVTDASEAPLVQARKRLQPFSHVTVEKMAIPADFVRDSCDLIVLSEVAYYLNDDDLTILRKKTVEHLIIGGQLLLVHWTPLVHDYPQTGDGVHEFFLQLKNKSLHHLLHQRQETYRLDLFEKY